MNKFELFTMIYFWLDTFYENTTDDSIVNQLSDMNPFLWEDLTSADPAVYSEYCSFIAGRDITMRNSLDLAREYVKTIDNAWMTDAFENIDPEEWIKGCRDYLATSHKGMEEDI